MREMLCSGESTDSFTELSSKLLKLEEVVPEWDLKVRNFINA